MAYTENTVTAAEFENRLARLLEERFGAGRGALLQRADKAALYLPADLARRLRELVQNIADLKSGASRADPLVFRASAEAIMASLRAPAIRRGVERGDWRKRFRYVVLGLLLLSPVIIFLSLLGCALAPTVSCEASRGTLSLLLVLSTYFIWPSFLYWVMDRAVKNAIPDSRGRVVARTVVFMLFFWAAGAWLVGYCVNPLGREGDEDREGDADSGSWGGSSAGYRAFDDDDSVLSVNPATGLPMRYGVDAAGNCYGDGD